MSHYGGLLKLLTSDSLHSFFRSCDFVVKLAIKGAGYTTDCFNQYLLPHENLLVLSISDK
ncbi:hypothetical protein T11_2959 [Trichinella zimbabwensis]|uniref:Uncharacterized protein n=1 Tax=Trichinella zimbabwensis TaxID=268475 RepID=A0A0V1I400_9BILA|nr:hypothetical protein T11_2959 [Trichinella zimbabwensis]